MNLPFRRALLAIAAAALVGVAAIGPVSAAQRPDPLAAEAQANSGAKPCHEQWAAAKVASVDHLRRLGDCEIDRRLATLTTLDTRVVAARLVTDDHRSALRAEYAADRTGLTALRATIDAESSVTGLRADLKRIATDYRIYLLVVPKTAEVIAADSEVAAVARLADASSRLQARIDAAKAAGKDVTTAQADLDAMNAKAAQVTPLVQGVPAAVLPLTPAQFNAGTAKPVLVNSRTAIRNARALLVGARSDAKACIAALRELA